MPTRVSFHFKSSESIIWVSVFSHDKHNHENNFIKFGFGETFENNLVAHFAATSIDCTDILQKIGKDDIEFYGTNLIEKIGLATPFLGDIEPLLFGNNTTDIRELEKNSRTIMDLPFEIHPLYEKIKNISIPKYVYDAIEYSIETEGCMLNEKLKQKAGSLGRKETTYIRVLMGFDFGNQPGQPIVLEIWPKKHESPVHNHGNTTAVIKMLFGKLKTEWYNPLSEENEKNPKPVKTGYLNAGDFTFMTPFTFQTHKLINEYDSTAISVQTYAHTTKNADNNKQFSETFNFFKPDENKLNNFFPGKDFSYNEILEIAEKKYGSHLVKIN